MGFGVGGAVLIGEYLQEYLGVVRGAWGQQSPKFAKETEDYLAGQTTKNDPFSTNNYYYYR